MNRSLIGVSPSTQVSEAEAVATASGVNHLLVLECDDLVGITNVGDLHRASRGAKVGDCMNASVPTISATASIDEAAEVMRDCDVDCLPVVAGGLILGVVTRDSLREAREIASA